jgi:phosphoglycerol geranylgeranyltransferase
MNVNHLNKTIVEKFNNKTGELAILIDPEKENDLEKLVPKIIKANFSYIFVGGSTCTTSQIKFTVHQLKKLTNLPIILFPGSNQQISKEADALLYLSLLSGNNLEYISKQHIDSSLKIRKLNIEIIPTAYLLINGLTQSSVQKISETNPIDRYDWKKTLKTSLAGEFLGMKSCYLDAGSGAKKTIPISILKSLKSKLKVPIIVGGGVNSTKKIITLKKIGINVIVIGNALEKNDLFFEEICLINSTEKS